MNRFLYFVIPLSSFLIIWIPLIIHYHTTTVAIADEAINRARHMPDDSVLDEILGFFQSHVPEHGEDFIPLAEQMMHGEFNIPGCSSIKFILPFNSKDFHKGSVNCRQRIASFWVPRVLVNAYALTKRDEYLITARDVILDWAKYERNIRIPQGSIWKDYPVSYRISVLSKFWKHYRNHHSFNSSVARAVFELVSRSGQLLARPSHFVFMTNHGIMQNLALMQLCIAFPEIPDVQHYKEVAMKRMNEQMRYYINDEGIVLEHSAKYHGAGIEFVSMAIRYVSLLDEPIPDDWIDKYEKSIDFYAHLSRPDESLPVYGDTRKKRQLLGPLVLTSHNNKIDYTLRYKKKWNPHRLNSLYPVAGYSIWWNGVEGWPDLQKLNQTVVIWSNYSEAHKHADEMSILLWAGGENWWTNIGYWPYGTKGRRDAISWRGSNAPHLLGESYQSKRYTELKYHGAIDGMHALDLERTGPGEFAVRRQLIFIKPNLWIIIDSSAGSKNDRTETVWTTSSNISLTEGNFPDSFILKNNEGLFLRAFLMDSGDTLIKQYKGSFKPFLGWENKNEPTSAIIVEQPINSWSAILWLLEDSNEASLKIIDVPNMQKWDGIKNWKIELQLQTGLMKIGRDGESIYVNGDSNDAIKKILNLIKSPGELRSKYKEIGDAHELAARKYSGFRGLTYRWKATKILMMLLILQEVFFFFTEDLI